MANTTGDRMSWDAAIITGILGAIGGFIVAVFRAPADFFRSWAETRKTKTEDAALLVETSLKVIDALNEQVDRVNGRVAMLEKHLQEAQQTVATLEASLTRMQAHVQAYELRFGEL